MSKPEMPADRRPLRERLLDLVEDLDCGSYAEREGPDVDSYTCNRIADELRAALADGDAAQINDGYLCERLRQISDYHESVAKHTNNGWHDDAANFLRELAVERAALPPAPAPDFDTLNSLCVKWYEEVLATTTSREGFADIRRLVAAGDKLAKGVAEASALARPRREG